MYRVITEFFDTDLQETCQVGDVYKITDQARIDYFLILNYIEFVPDKKVKTDAES